MTRDGSNTEEVRLYTSPWVSGTRASSYFGPITVKRFVPSIFSHDWEKGIDEAVLELQAKAKKLGANSIVGIVLELDPHAKEEGTPGLHVSIVGTAAVLERLF